MSKTYHSHYTKIDLIVTRKLRALRNLAQSCEDPVVPDFIENGRINMEELYNRSIQDPFFCTPELRHLAFLYMEIKTIGLEIRNITTTPIIIGGTDVLQNVGNLNIIFN